MGFKTMNKKGLNLKNAFFSAIAFGMFILAIGTIVGDWSSKYDSGLTYDLEDDYSDIDTFSEEAQEQRERITVESDDPGGGDLEGQLFRGGYGVIGRLFTPFRATFAMFDSLERRFGLPSYIGEGFLAMMYISLITLIIGIIFRLARSNA